MHVVDASREYDRQRLIHDVLLSMSATAGRPDFGDCAIDAVSRLLPVDHLSVFFETDGGAVACQLAASRADRSKSPKLARIYGERFFRQDPFRLATLDPQRPSSAMVGRLRPEDLHNGAYRSECYDRHGVAERISVRSTQPGATYFFNLYRARATGPFSEGEVQLTVTAASLLLPALARHAASLAQRGDTRKALTSMCERLQGLGRGLTRREVQVLGRGLIGMTTEGIGLDLELKMTSVATFRKRAYAKLGISSQAELYSRLLS